MVDLNVKVADLILKNPLIAASGTFGFGREMAEFYNISTLGGISTKGFTRLPRKGNPAPRVAECDCGMLNAVGLQNPGLETVLQNFLLCVQQMRQLLQILQAILQKTISISLSGWRKKISRR